MAHASAGSARTAWSAIAGEGFGRQRLLWVDAQSRKVVARRAYSGWNVNTLTVPAASPWCWGRRRASDRSGSCSWTSTAAIRTIRVDGIKAGAEYAEASDPAGQVLTPAVTVDREGGRLYVVAARGLLVAEVDLASGAVTYHSLGASASKGNVGVWWRDAVWAGDGRIAVTGDHWPPSAAGGPPSGPVPFGVRMIDTSDWSIDDARSAPRLDARGRRHRARLGHALLRRRPAPESTGLLAFDDAGRRAYTRFRGRQVALLGSRGTSGTSGSGGPGRRT